LRDQPERADLETTITDLLSGQYDNPVSVVAFNTAERWANPMRQWDFASISRRSDLRVSGLNSLRDSRLDLGSGGTKLGRQFLECLALGRVGGQSADEVAVLNIGQELFQLYL
jgi:hypothetical protein